MGVPNGYRVNEIRTMFGNNFCFIKAIDVQDRSSVRSCLNAFLCPDPQGILS